MVGPLICYATSCTEDLTAGEVAGGILLAIVAVTGIVLLVKWLTPDK